MRAMTEREEYYLAMFGPGLDAVLSEASSEGPQVGDDPSGDENISCQVVVRALQVVCCYRPSKDRIQVIKRYY